MGSYSGSVVLTTSLMLLEVSSLQCLREPEGIIFKVAVHNYRALHADAPIAGATPKFLGGPNPSLHLSPSFPFTFSSPSPVSLHAVRSRLLT